MLKYANHPSTVEFGELECCALMVANARAEHQSFISTFIANAQKSEHRYRVAILSEIFTSTARLVFIPRDVHRRFYIALALAELQLLKTVLSLRPVPENLATPAFKDNPDSLLGCEHSAAEHIEALRLICSKMAIAPGNN